MERARGRERVNPAHSEDSWERAKGPEFHIPHIRFQLNPYPTLNQKSFLSSEKTLSFDSLSFRQSQRCSRVLENL